MQKQLEVYGNIVKIYQLDANDDDIVIFADGNTTDSFKFKLKITDRTGNDGTKDVEIMVPLKYLSNFW